MMMGMSMSDNETELLEFKTKCPECRRWVTADEFYYGHDCEEEEEIVVYKMRSN